MKPDRDPVVIDLAQRRKAAEAEAARKAAERRPAQEPILGGRPNARMILALLAGAALLLWLVPRLI